MSGVFRRLDGKVLPSWQHCTKLLAVYWKKVRYAGKGQFARSARDQCFRWALGGVVPKRTWDGGQNLQRRCTPAAADCAVLRHQRINVRPKDADKAEWFTADNQAAGSDNLCFLTSSAPEEVVAHLKANGVTIEEGPVDMQGARGTIRSVYCRDPDGSLIEISSYNCNAS